MIVAVREDELGLFVGFFEDHELLECDRCTADAAYRLWYGSDYRGSLEEYRFMALQLIANEHPIA